MIRTWLILLILCVPCVQAETYSLVVQGLGGTAEYENSFYRDAETIASTFSRLSTRSDNHVLLAGAKSTRDNIQGYFNELINRMNASDSFILTLIGHGTFDGTRFKFNIPGPDLSDQELDSFLSKLPGKQQLLVFATSSSGVLVDLLLEDGRTVITATKSGRERHAVLFPGFWAEAMVSESADINKDELLSAAEAFQFAESKVQVYYKSNDLLASEHPRISQRNSRKFYLARTGKLQGSENNAQIQSLLDQRTRLADQFYALKEQKSGMPEATYLNSLETIMLRMAKLQQSIDAELDASQNAKDNS